MRYFEIIELEQRVVNCIIYDGVSPYTPPVGQYLLAETEAPGIAVGWKKIDGIWTAPPVVEKIEQEN